MSKRYLILFAVSLLFFASCEEDFELRNTSFKPSIVVNSIFTSGKPWKVDLSYSRDRLDPTTSIQPILNAEVLIVEKFTNRVIFLAHEGNGTYTANTYLPNPDRTYELTVNVPGEEVVKASSLAPKKANINIISDVVEKLEFEINDVNKNYYIWNLVYTNNKNQIDTTSNTNPRDLVKGINNYNDLSTYLTNLSTPKINDAETSGVQRTKYYFDYSKLTDDQDGQNPDPIKKKYLRLLTTSKELYDYYKTIEKYSVSVDHNCSFCQTPEIKSNIINGLGIFAGYTEDFKEIK